MGTHRFYLNLAKTMLAIGLVAPSYFSQKSIAQCQPLGSITLSVVNLDPSIQGNNTICPGSTTVLSLTDSYDAYAWSTGSADPSITVSDPNTYSVTVSTSSGCTATAQFTVTGLNAPNPSITEAPYACNNMIELDANPGFTNYLWSNGDMDPHAIANASGTYTVTVTNSDGCTATASTVVTIPAAPQVSIAGEPEFCAGSTTILQATPGFSNYFWTGGFFQDNIEVGFGGLYQVTVTDAIGCTGTAEITVAELTFTPPTIIGNLSVCGNNSTLLTAEGMNYTNYQWSSGQGTQSILVSTPGTYSVTVASNNGCTGSTSATVVDGGNASTSITGNTTICPGASTTLTATGSFSTYTWSNGMSGQSINVNQTGNYTVTVSDGQGCIGTATAIVTNEAIPSVSISPVAGNICEGDAPFNLAATPTGGTWSGDVGANGQVDPAALGTGNWTASYSFTTANGCVGTDQLDFEVLAGTVASISAAGPFCENEGLQTLSASPVGGTWGGAANANGQIDPTLLGPGSYSVTYTAAAAGACTGNASIMVQVVETPSATIAGGGTICEGSGQSVPINISTAGNGPIELSYTIGGGIPTTLNLTVGANSFNASTPGTYQILAVTDANGCTGMGMGQAIVATVGSPQVVGLDLQCDPSNTNYTLVFGLTGGDPASYTVTSAINGVLAGPPYLFTSDPIPSNSTYQFTVNDVNNCNPTILQGTFNCLCATDAGTMSALPLSFCAGEAATVAMSTGNNLENDDALVYVLHDGNSNSLGTVFSTNTIPSFDFLPPLVAGVTYYVSAVAGNNNGLGGLDFNDPCLSVSIGTPIAWTNLPTGSLSTSNTICEGESATLVFSLTGNGPFDVTYTDGSFVYPLTNINSGHSIPVSPTVSTTYTLSLVTETNGAACSSVPGTSANVTVLGPSTTNVQDTSCDPSQVGVFTQTYMGQNGCDSIVNLTVSYQAFDETFLTANTCDPAQAGVFTQTLTNQNGCDSIVTTTVNFVPADLTNLSDTSCDPSQVGVFTQTYTNQSGCDSTVVLTVTYQAFDETFLSATTCDPAQAGIFVQNLVNQNGCDSIVTTTVALLPSDFTQLSATTCDPTQAGVFTQNLVNQAGCDSIVVTTVSLLPSSLTQLLATTCDQSQVGVFTQNYTGQNGCDSTVVTTVSLLPPSECGVLFQLVAATIPCSSTTGSITIDLTLGEFPLNINYSGSSGVFGNGTMTTSPFELTQLPAGSYTITLTNSSGLSSTATIQLVQATPPTLDVSVLNGLDCSGEPIGSLSATPTGNFPPYSLLWSNGGTTATISNLPAGQYQVTATGGLGCETTATIDLPAVPPLVIGLSVSAPDCFDINGGFVQVEATGGQAPYQYSLNGGGFVTDGLFTGLTGGTYQIEAMDANGCKSTEGFAINLPLELTVSLGEDMTIELGDGATLTAVVNLPDSLLANIAWTGLGENTECPTCLTQIVTPLVTTTYTITVQSEAGCIGSDELTVIVNKKRAVFVPNAFSPDDDGINDVFFPFAKNSAVEKVNSFHIFSRWGELVFSATNFQPNDPTHGWDGKHRGEALNAAVFVWFAEIKFTDGEVVLFEGDVTLMR